MITVEQLAADKKLDRAFLERVGVHGLPGGNVGITYYDAAGNAAVLRIRTALKAKEGSR